MVDERQVITEAKTPKKVECFTRRQLEMIGVAVVCVIVFSAFLHFSTFDCEQGTGKDCIVSGKQYRKKRLLLVRRADVRSKRDWLSDILGVQQSTTTRKKTTTTQKTVTEDDFDKFLDSLFGIDYGNQEGNVQSGSTAPKAPKRKTTSVGKTSTTGGPTVGKTTTSRTISNRATTSGHTAGSVTSTTPPSSTERTTGTTSTKSTRLTSPRNTFMTSPRSKATGNSTTTVQASSTKLPSCADRNFRLSDKCNVPDQLKQQNNFNITYQDFLDSVKSDHLVSFWERCLHGGSCAPDVEADNEAKGLAERWINGNNKPQLCPWLGCLDSIKRSSKFCMKDKDLVFNITDMLCSVDFHINEKSRRCAKDIIMMLDRNMAAEKDMNSSLTTERCENDFSPCKTDCKTYYENMVNLFDASCHHFKHSGIKTFYPWRWFTDHHREIKTTCQLKVHHGKGTHFRGREYYEQLLKDKGMVAGIVLSAVVTMVAVIILGVILAKKYRKGKYYERDGIEYSEVTGLMDDAEDRHKHHF